MKKSILNLGKTLNKTEQKNINGGSDNPINSCKCDSRTGKYYDPHCGSTCHEEKDEEDNTESEY